MKIKKIISKGLVLGLIFNNMGYSFANVKNLNGRYETFEGNNITIDNVLEEDIVDMEIEGNTLVNLSETKELLDRTKTHYDDIYLCELDKIKSNTTYTVLYDFDCDIDFTFETCYFGYSFTTPSTMHTQFSGNRHNAKKGSNIGIFNLTSDQLQTAKNAGAKYFQVRVFIDDDKKVKQYSTKNVRLLEGDWRNKEIPQHFEGMKSVGQNYDSNIAINSFENKIKQLDRGTVASIDGVPYDRTDRLRTNLFEVSSNEINIKGITDKETSLVFCYDKNKNYLGKARDDWNKDRDNIQLKDNTKFVYVVWRISDNVEILPEDYKDIIIYETSNTSKKNILLKQPLRALPNGVKDRLIKKNGQWVVERNTKEIVLTGSESENWMIGHEYVNIDSNETISIQRSFTDMAYGKDVGIQLISELFPSYNYITVSETIPGVENKDIREDKQWIRSYSSTSGSVGVRILKSKLTSPTIEGFREWLSNNNLKVIYQLKEPIYEPINDNLAIQLFKNTTYISNNSIIPTTMKVTIDRAINRAVEAIEIAKQNATVHNISQARMWTNLMKESSNKDIFNNQINDITEIKDLTIEKKTATANVDVYIKSKNGLSMTLSTNSIVFDEFSGTEDMEKLNAVNVTVDSSLPYSLNSYLMSEIKNENGTNIISKELFNIKINGENDYKAFANLNEKLVLKEDCSRGKNTYGIDLILKGSLTHEADVYKTTIKFEAEQK